MTRPPWFAPMRWCWAYVSHHPGATPRRILAAAHGRYGAPDVRSALVRLEVAGWLRWDGAGYTAEPKLLFTA